MVNSATPGRQRRVAGLPQSRCGHTRLEEDKMAAWRSLVALIALTVFAQQGVAAEWVATWGAAPVPPSPAMGPFPATPTFNNQTIRQVVRISAGGDRVRVRFTNEYGT